MRYDTLLTHRAHMFFPKPLSNTDVRLFLIGRLQTNLSDIWIEKLHFHSISCNSKCRQQDGSHFSRL